MSEPYLAEISIFGFNFPPRSWAQCDGQILPINQNQSLYSLLGTTYGGDGRVTFALPDLRGRSAIHEGNGNNLGTKGGSENVVLTTAQIPGHTHSLQGSSAPASSPIPAGNVLADSSPNEIYHSPMGLVPAHAGTVENAGGGQGHNNMQPYIVVNFCICTAGLFPSQS